MSDSCTIHDVSSSLKKLLESSMGSNADIAELGGPVNVSIGFPDEAGQEFGVNLFLYHLVPRPDVYGRKRPGEGGRPSLNLELHYLITAHVGRERHDDVKAQQVLGEVMRVLQNNPILECSSGGAPNEVARANISLEPLTVTDITSIFVALTVPYRLSISYKVTALDG